MLYDLRIEYQKNPIGIDQKPRFSWKLKSQHENVVQTAYRIQVSCKNRIVWDTGKVESQESVLIPWAGGSLSPQTIYQVKIQVWNNYEEYGEIHGAFETGLMEEKWHAQWITHLMSEEDTVCPVFVQNFRTKKRVQSARLYATACGLYEAKINREKVGDSFLAPGWTSYHHRLQYQTYDVTRYIKEENEIAVTVANGWFKGDLGFDIKPNNYGNQVALLAMLCITYEDGTTEYIGTDTEWKVEKREVRFSEIYHGEMQDFQSAVETCGQAVVFEHTDEIGKLCAQENEPVRITRRFPVKEKIITPKGEIVFDFGQNMAGLVEVTLPKLTGEQLVIRHAETLDKEGNFYTENLRQAKCTDIYKYGREEENKTVIPHFTFHGFRYICVEGVNENVDQSLFTACALHTDMEECGTFTCSNALVNQLQSNIVWGQRSNFVDVPTDCPQRDERLGWTGDAQVFCGTASYQFQTALFFRKWLRDMQVETTEEWGVPHVVPNILGNQAGAAAWSDAATIIPWSLYQTYGDQEMLAEQYPMMKAWVEYMNHHCSENGLWQTGFQYGDWLALDIESGSSDRTGGTDKYLVANAYYALSTRIVRDSAKVLGYATDVEKYENLHEQIISAINREFVTSTGRLVSETQTACVLMLYFDLARPEHRKRILQTLEQNIEAHHNHLTTGFVGTPYLCHCLSENGLHELADSIFLKEDFPGWLYAVKKGATTIWERWNSVLPDGSFDESGMNSLNHYAYGSIGSWLYQKVAGIQALEPGYKKIKIAPILTKGFSEVKASYESVYGKISSEISCKNGQIIMDVEIPCNTTAVICIPEQSGEITVGSGHYHYVYETETSLAYDKYTMESTLGELVGQELGRTMFEQMVPGMLDNPLIQYAYEMTISELLLQAPDAKPLYQAVIDALNKSERDHNGE